MSAKRTKSEFSARMNEIAEEATKLVEGQKNKSVIIIATESDDDGTETMIAVSGYGGELTKGIAQFATRDESKGLFARGLELAVINDKLAVINGID